MAAPAQASSALEARARAIHRRVLVMDTHNDISPANFQWSRNYRQDLGNQVNLPKMIAGGLDASWFVVYVGQSNAADAFEPASYERAYGEAVAKFEAIHMFTRAVAPDQIELALTAADARRIYANGKKVALIGVENGYPLGDETTAIRRVKEFYDRGARYMSLAHNGHSQLSDSNTGEQTGWKWNGLSPLGMSVIAEMNKWGIMVDVSHPSKASMMQAVELSKAPIIASHSAARALCDVSRNMDDDQLEALKRNGGVIQTVAFASYIRTDSPERRRALDAVRAEFKLPQGTPLGAGRGRGAGAARAGGGGGRGNALTLLTDEQRADLQRRVAQIDETFPPSARATVKDLVDHIDYLVRKIGIDHVGISSDFDGGGGVDGWDGADETFNVTMELVRRGYSEARIAKLWSGNLLRVMEEVEKIAKRLQRPSGAATR